MPMLKLYSYFRSSASFRVRAALHWKELAFDYIPIHLLKDGGQQNLPAYRKINPMGHVPALEHDGFLIAESMAILQYLDDVFPGKNLFPTPPHAKAQVMQICEIVNSGIQPLQNLKIGKYLGDEFGMTKADSDRFTKHWIQDGMTNLERVLETTAGTYCVGGEITAADCFVAPQCFAAKRFGVEADQFPNLSRVYANASRVKAFQLAHPEKQPDYIA
jgi:maleylacetoacetate isomerase